MITLEQYFGDKQHPPEHEDAAEVMLNRVSNLLEFLGWDYPIDPDTGTSISGSKGGAGDGGYRLGNAATGKPFSKHKTGHAVDVFDPDNRLDDMIDDAKLEMFNLYREAPSFTRGWTHLQDVAPGSAKRTFLP